MLPPPKVSMRLMRDAHCSATKALQAMHTFAVFHGESRLAALRRSGIEFICEPLLDERVNGKSQSCDAFFVRWICSPPFQLPALYGVVSAIPNGLMTTAFIAIPPASATQTVTLKEGQPAALTFVATQGVHGITAPDIGLDRTVTITSSPTTVTVTPHKAGTFISHCAIFCGIGHAKMQIVFKVVK